MANQEEVSGTHLNRLFDWLGDLKYSREVTVYPLLALAFVFLAMAWWLLGHDEFFEHIVPHVFSVVLELFLALVVIEIVWRSREKREEMKQRETQLRHIKCYMFQAPMRNLFAVNFGELESPDIKFENIRDAGNREDFRGQFEDLKLKLAKDGKKLGNISYKVGGADKVFLEYMKAEEEVWEKFLDLAVKFSFPPIVKDMTEILSYIDQARRAVAPKVVDKKEALKVFEDIVSKQSKLQLKPELQSKIEEIMKKGILKFIEYAKDVKEHDPDMFTPLMDLFDPKMKVVDESSTKGSIFG